MAVDYSIVCDTAMEKQPNLTIVYDKSILSFSRHSSEKPLIFYGRSFVESQYIVLVFLFAYVQGSWRCLQKV